MFLMLSFLLQVIICIYFLIKIFKKKKRFLLGLSWAAATTEGVLVYSLNTGFVFDPFHLEIGITPMKTKETLNKKEYALGKINL